jgi:hypothetical protein
MKKLVIISAFILLTSFKIGNDKKAIIYIMRPSIVGFAVKLNIKENNNEIGQLAANNYLKFEIEEGFTTLSNNFDKSSKLELDIRSNNIYYIKNNIQPSLFTKRSSFELLTEEEGKKILEKISR